MSEYLFTLNFLNFYKNFLWEDFIVVLLLYNFIKYLIMCAMIELIWPTQFFNRRHNTGYQAFRLRTYTETLLKLRGYSSFFYVFNYFVIKYKFILGK
jgi:hypothetical protein